LGQAGDDAPLDGQIPSDLMIGCNIGKVARIIDCEIVFKDFSYSTGSRRSSLPFDPLVAPVVEEAPVWAGTGLKPKPTLFVL
jgi:hypothetical protein